MDKVRADRDKLRADLASAQRAFDILGEEEDGLRDSLMAKSTEVESLRNALDKTNAMHKIETAQARLDSTNLNREIHNLKLALDENKLSRRIEQLQKDIRLKESSLQDELRREREKIVGLRKSIERQEGKLKDVEKRHAAKTSTLVKHHEIEMKAAEQRTQSFMADTGSALGRLASKHSSMTQIATDPVGNKRVIETTIARLEQILEEYHSFKSQIEEDERSRKSLPETYEEVKEMHDEFIAQVESQARNSKMHRSVKVQWLKFTVDYKAIAHKLRRATRLLRCRHFTELPRVVETVYATSSKVRRTNSNLALQSEDGVITWLKLAPPAIRIMYGRLLSGHFDQPFYIHIILQEMRYFLPDDDSFDDWGGAEWIKDPYHDMAKYTDLHRKFFAAILCRRLAEEAAGVESDEELNAVMQNLQRRDKVSERDLPSSKLQSLVQTVSRHRRGLAMEKPDLSAVGRVARSKGKRRGGRLRMLRQALAADKSDSLTRDQTTSTRERPQSGKGPSSKAGKTAKMANGSIGNHTEPRAGSGAGGEAEAQDTSSSASAPSAIGINDGAGLTNTQVGPASRPENKTVETRSDKSGKTPERALSRLADIDETQQLSRDQRRRGRRKHKTRTSVQQLASLLLPDAVNEQMTNDASKVTSGASAQTKQPLNTSSTALSSSGGRQRQRRKQIKKSTSVAQVTTGQTIPPGNDSHKVGTKARSASEPSRPTVATNQQDSRTGEPTAPGSTGHTERIASAPNDDTTFKSDIFTMPEISRGASAKKIRLVPESSTFGRRSSKRGKANFRKPKVIERTNSVTTDNHTATTNSPSVNAQSDPGKRHGGFARNKRIFRLNLGPTPPRSIAVSASGLDLPQIRSDDRYTMGQEEKKLAHTMIKQGQIVYWSHTLYRSQQGRKVKRLYCSSHAAAELVANGFKHERVLGFDMEWESNAIPGLSSIKDSCSVIQIAAEDRVAVFHIAAFRGHTTLDLMPPSLRLLLESAEIIKAGVNIGGDFTRLRNNLGIEGRGIFELSHMYKLVRYSETQPELVNKVAASLSEQVEQVLGFPLDKGEVRTSAWSQKLSNEQIDYAVTDAYAGYQLFHELDRMRMDMDPIPPLPAMYEEKKPLMLGNGKPPPRQARKVKMPSEDEKNVKNVADQSRVIDTEHSQTLSMTDLDAEMSSLSLDDDHNVTTPDGLSTSIDGADIEDDEANDDERFDDRQDDPRVREAQQWVEQYIADRRQLGRATCGATSLCAYRLWYEHGLEVDEVATRLREPPLKTSTVRGYIAKALVSDRSLPHDGERLRQVLRGLPAYVLVRFKGLAQRLETRKL